MTLDAFARGMRRAVVPLKLSAKSFVKTCLIVTLWVVAIMFCLGFAAAAWDAFQRVSARIQAQQVWLLVAAMPGGDPIELRRWEGKVGGEAICKIERDHQWHT